VSELEFDMVKRHTVVGGDILSNASLPWPIAESQCSIMNDWTVAATPKDCEATQLPFRPESCGGDVVEAMTQHRPYRAGLGIDAALAEVTNGAGSRYDADVVAACLKVFEDGYVLDSDPARLGANWSAQLCATHVSRSWATGKEHLPFWNGSGPAHEIIVIANALELFMYAVRLAQSTHAISEACRVHVVNFTALTA